MAKSIISITILGLFIKSLFIISQLHVCMSEPNNLTGFSMDLIHRDSPESPYYDPSLSPTETLVNALRRSLDRMRRLNRNYSLQSTQTDVIPSLHSGDYLMKYSIGHPPVQALGTMDTSSGLTWTQCHPCKECIKQGPPLYTPSHSSDYRDIACHSLECHRSLLTYCTKEDKRCLYQIRYLTYGFSWGSLSKDTFTLASEGGTSTSVPNMIFGCGDTTINSTFYGYQSGAIGLGRGPNSLLPQLGFLAKGKFSYCLVTPFDQLPKPSRSRLNFGDSADVSGNGVVHIPLELNPYNQPFYYFVTLYGYNLGTQRYMFPSENGNIFVDTGFMETRLPDEMYESLKSSMIKALSYLKTIKDPKGVLDLCFATARDNLWLIPTVTFHFKGGDVSFAKNNMFVRTGPSSLCLAVLPAGGGPAVLGSIAQMNFMVGYDIYNDQISFKRTDCSK